MMEPFALPTEFLASNSDDSTSGDCFIPHSDEATHFAQSNR